VGRGAFTYGPHFTGRGRPFGYWESPITERRQKSGKGRTEGRVQLLKDVRAPEEAAWNHKQPATKSGILHHKRSGTAIREVRKGKRITSYIEIVIEDELIRPVLDFPRREKKRRSCKLDQAD